MAQLQTFWVVRDPNRFSIITDICWSTYVEEFILYARGIPKEVLQKENHAFFTTQEEARAEAQIRLDARVP